MTDWDKAYLQLSKSDPLPPEPGSHWGWHVVGMVAAMLTLAWLGAWIAEGLS